MVPRNRKFSEYINRKPASNVHHAIRIAEAIGLPLNVCATINFDLTSCPPEKASAAFQNLLGSFRKWVTRPVAAVRKLAVPATFVWVIENPNSVTNVHWLVHVPPERQADFQARLPQWLTTVSGEILDRNAIHIQPAYAARSLGRYMLKGIQPGVAHFYAVDAIAQGWVRGKRSGFSRNLGPKEKQRLREAGIYKKTVRRAIMPAQPPLTLSA